MAPTYTRRTRAAKLEPFTLQNAWGSEQNAATIDIQDAAWGVSEVTVNADVALTVANALPEQARSIALILTGAGGFVVTAPAVDKPYLVVNNCTNAVTVKPAGGTGATIRAGVASWYYTNAAGSIGYVVDPTLDKIKAPTAAVDMGGQKLTGLANGTSAPDAVTFGQFTDLINSTAVGTVAAINSQVVTVAGISVAVSAVAAVDDETVLVASIAGSVVQLAGMFVGARATDPTTRLSGAALQSGDYYLNIAGTPAVRFYSGSAWIPIEAVTLSSQAQAEAGTNNTNVMTPLRTAQAIASLASGYQEFTASGTWAKPAQAKWVYVEVVGGGGGGASGRRGAAAASKSGGGGGSGSVVVTEFFSAASLPSSLTITVGAAGQGGAPTTVNDTNGNAGTGGGSSSFGSLVVAGGGKGAGASGISSSVGGEGIGWYGSGAASTPSPYQGGTAATSAFFGSSAGGNSTSSTVSAGGSSQFSAGSGGGGAGEDASNVLAVAGAGGATRSSIPGSGSAAGVSNASAPTAGADGSAFGIAGGGGGSSITAAAARGGHGGVGAGGGGGGSSRNGFASGAGGNGGAGRVRVWWG